MRVYRYRSGETSYNKISGQSLGRRTRRSAVAQDYLRYGDVSTVTAKHSNCETLGADESQLRRDLKDDPVAVGSACGRCAKDIASRVEH